jgi:hypothetical protein
MSNILNKVRKLNWTLQESPTGVFSFDDLCEILSDLMEANVYILEFDGIVVGASEKIEGTTNLIKDEKSGKATPQKVGMGTVQRDGMDYEFTLMFELDRDSHLASAGKDRTCLFQDPGIISEDTGKKILAWLSSSQPIQEQTQPEQNKTKKQDPLEYVKSDLNNRMEAGDDPEQILKDYSNILKMDVKSIDTLEDKDITYLARALFISNRNKGENNG